MVQPIPGYQGEPVGWLNVLVVVCVCVSNHSWYAWLACRYTRNLVEEGNDQFNLIVLCWGEGQGR